MDSLTARLMYRSGLGTAGRLPAHNTPMIKAGIGLNPSKPLLPPVHNLRMVYLKEPIKDAEIALHDARVELDKVQKSGPTAPLAPLYNAMAKLEVAERDYFARRYFGGEKAILKGWTIAKFRLKINQMYRTDRDEETALTDTTTGNVVAGFHKDARDAARLSAAASKRLRIMYRKYYNSRGVAKPTPSQKDLDEELDNIAKCVQFINELLGNVPTLNISDGTKKASIKSIKASLRRTEARQRLARLLAKNQWDLPRDLET